MEAGQASKTAGRGRHLPALAIGTSSTRTVISSIPARSTLAARRTPTRRSWMRWRRSAMTQACPHSATIFRTAPQYRWPAGARRRGRAAGAEGGCGRARRRQGRHAGSRCWAHDMVVTHDGALWGGGRGQHGELGMGDRADRLTLVRVGPEEGFGQSGVLMVGCGFAHTDGGDGGGRAVVMGRGSGRQGGAQGRGGQGGAGEGWGGGAGRGQDRVRRLQK
jgi:hypothetical protein